MVDTIFALSSGAPPSAVAIVRVSGSKVRDVMTALCRRELGLREAVLCNIFDPLSGDRIDSGIVIFFSAPNSFTGEDCLEFQVHGSRAVITRLLRTLGDMPGLRPAEPGEFARRAFELGKLPLSSIEGLADLIDAKTEGQRRQALQQAGGILAERSVVWRKQLLDARSLLEAEIDFADEGEAPASVMTTVRAIGDGLISEWERALMDSARAETIRSGYKVVILGAPNAGKSSLLNALARREAAIVTEHSGTTRDIIEVELDLEGFAVTLCDTAGLRETQDPVEAIGIDRAQRSAQSASLVILLADASGQPPDFDPGHDRRVVVASKLDLAADFPAWAELGVSVVSPDGCRSLIDRLAKQIRDEIGGEPPLLTHERQITNLRTAMRHLQSTFDDRKKPIEIVAEDLRRCSAILSELTGSMNTEDILSAVFSRFCMGK